MPYLVGPDGPLGVAKQGAAAGKPQFEVEGWVAENHGGLRPQDSSNGPLQGGYAPKKIA